MNNDRAINVRSKPPEKSPPEPPEAPPDDGFFWRTKARPCGQQVRPIHVTSVFADARSC